MLIRNIRGSCGNSGGGETHFGWVEGMLPDGRRHLSRHVSWQENFRGKEGKECTLAGGIGPANGREA